MKYAWIPVCCSGSSSCISRPAKPTARKVCGRPCAAKARQIVGWAMGERADQALASAVLAMALGRRQPRPGAIHDSDQGCQYTSGAYQPN